MTWRRCRPTTRRIFDPIILPLKHSSEETVMMRFVLPLAFAAVALPLAAQAELPADTAAAIVKMGHVNDPKTAPLFAPMHHGIPADIKVTRDLAFGSDPAQRLDMFTSGEGNGKPILIYVHGGGFTRGDKHPPGAFMY